MHNSLTGAVFLTLATFVAFIVQSHSEGESMEEYKSLQVGMVAPSFTLMDGDGVERNLSDFLGQKNVVLAFYPKDFTGG